MTYFYTNAPLRFILRTNGNNIDWEANGFNVRQIAKAVSSGMQRCTESEVISILPIFNQEIFQAALGALLKKNVDGDEFYKAIGEEEKDKILAEWQAAKTQTSITEAQNNTVSV